MEKKTLKTQKHQIQQGAGYELVDGYIGMDVIPVFRQVSRKKIIRRDLKR